MQMQAKAWVTPGSGEQLLPLPLPSSPFMISGIIHFSREGGDWMRRRTFLQLSAGSLCTAVASGTATAISTNGHFELGYWKGSDQLAELSSLELREEGFSLPGTEDLSSLAHQPVVAAGRLWQGDESLSGEALKITLWPVNFEAALQRRVSIDCHFPCQDRDRKVRIFQHSADPTVSTGAPVRFELPFDGSLRMTIDSGEAQPLQLRADSLRGGKLRRGVYVLAESLPKNARFSRQRGSDGAWFRLSDRLGFPVARPHLLLTVERA